MTKRLIICTLMLMLWQLASAQMPVSRKTYIIDDEEMYATTRIDADEFHPVLLDSIIIDQINFILAERDCEALQYRQLMFAVANEQSEYMAMMADENPNAKLREPVGYRLRSHGGSDNAVELTTKMNVLKGKEPLSYFKMAEDMVFRWMSNGKTAAMFESTNYQYIGVSSHIDMTGKKVYVSVVLGNYKSDNEGVHSRNLLSVPYSVKAQGLEGYDPEVCKRINRLTYLHELQKGLYIEDNQIFIELENAKQLQRLLRNKSDGLAIDILQDEQYDCKFDRNVIDYDRFNRGVLTKRCSAKKILKKNIADKSLNQHAFKAKLADWPAPLNPDNCEMNLLIIQDGAVCTSVPKTFIHPIKGTYKNNVRLLADTVSINSHFSYKPIPDSADLTFVIPFKGNKADYNAADIEPILEALEQPDFTILNMGITAYSSVEGSDSVNRNLQHRRAESIVRALESRQSDSIQTQIITDYNWDDFVADISQTKYRKWVRLSIEQVQDSISQQHLTKELEPILEKHRYARVNMRIVYDVSGKNELPFVVRKFIEACDSSDNILALSIQKFVMKRVLSGAYPVSVLDQMPIPDDCNFSGLAMNALWLRYKMGQLKMHDLKEQIAALAETNPQNEYIVFNDLLMQITYPGGLFKDIGNRLQASIDRLYYTPLRKETIDRLNLRLQLRTISEVDSVSHVRSIKTACVERIKKIVDIKTESMENSLKLAELFLDSKDYMLTIKTLEPWVEGSTNMQLLLTYVSLCSLFENQMHTSAFESAMESIRLLDRKKYCELLSGKGDGFSLRVLENERIRSGKCEYCTPQR